ncbi:MAG: phage protein Gp27 family protein [Paracoccaceae bacterium]|jgi:ABC-type transport system involved in cytochrome bd biosynthesis fused ATPase/permease subunit
MPPPKKLDLIPEEIRRWLAEELRDRGFADILEVTEALNARIAAEGLELSIGKSAVGDFSKALKDQREAFAIADQLLSDLDIEREGEIHRVLMQMIATSAVQMIRSVREEDEHLDAKDLMSLGRMLKDLMASSGMREKLLDDERKRLTREAREAAQAEMDEALEATAKEAGLDGHMLDRLRRGVLGLRA